MTTALEYVAGLRELADWIEAHPDIARPGTRFSVYPSNTKAEAAACLAALMPCKKEYSDECLYIVREFGPITLSFAFLRRSVCTRRVVGTKHVEVHVIPSRFTAEQVIEAHDEDIVEWDCGESLLTANAAGSTQADNEADAI